MLSFCENGTYCTCCINGPENKKDKSYRVFNGYVANATVDIEGT